MREMVYYPRRLKEPIVLFDIETTDNYRLIAYNLGTHPTAYIGITTDSILYGVDKQDLDYFVRTHHGFTFAEEGDGDYLPEGYFWYGWDYAHYSDFCGSYLIIGGDGHKWTTEEIYKHSILALEDFRNLEKFVSKYFIRKTELLS